METLLSTIEHAATFAAEHATLSYGILFIGSYFEAIFGINFVVRGEFFFIIGSVLAGMGVLNVWIVAFVLIAGGILGDSSSYWIARRYGMYLIKKDRFVLNFKNFHRARAFIETYGAQSAFFARFLGPISWIMPFILGTYKIPYGQFLVYNILGVTLGISQFLVVGYFFGTNYKAILLLVQKYALFSILGIIALVLLIRYVRKHRHLLIEHVTSLWNSK